MPSAMPSFIAVGSSLLIVSPLVTPGDGVLSWADNELPKQQEIATDNAKIKTGFFMCFDNLFRLDRFTVP